MSTTEHVLDAAPARVVVAPRGVLARLRHDRAALTGSALVAVVVVAAVAAPLITRINGVDPYTYHSDLLRGDSLPVGRFGGVSGSHWFGVEPRTGRDLFAIVLYGRAPPSRSASQPPPSRCPSAWWSGPRQPSPVGGGTASSVGSSTSSSGSPA